MDNALCHASEQIGGRPRFILSAFLKLAIAALPAPRATPLIGSSLIARLIDPFDAALVEPLAAVPVGGGRRGIPALLGQGDKGARDLIAAAQENILELTPRWRSTSIHRRRPASASRRSTGMRLSGNTGEIFVRHRVCVSFLRNSVLM
jgi:hypothetical protein